MSFFVNSVLNMNSSLPTLSGIVDVDLKTVKWSVRYCGACLFKTLKAIRPTLKRILYGIGRICAFFKNGVVCCRLLKLKIKRIVLFKIVCRGLRVFLFEQIKIPLQ